MFNQSIYDIMMDNDECWFITADGCSMLVADVSLLDC